jgi:hypothetical protein
VFCARIQLLVHQGVMIPWRQEAVLVVGLAVLLMLDPCAHGFGDDWANPRDDAVSKVRFHEVSSNEVDSVIAWLRSVSCGRVRGARVFLE